MKDHVNKSELIVIIKEYEKVDIRRSTSKAELMSILDEGSDGSTCSLVPIKSDMQTYIQNNIRKMRTQLPECTGMCTTHGCPDGVVVNCHLKLKPLMEK